MQPALIAPTAHGRRWLKDLELHLTHRLAALQAQAYSRSRSSALLHHPAGQKSCSTWSSRTSSTTWSTMSLCIKRESCSTWSSRTSPTPDEHATHSDVEPYPASPYTGLLKPCGLALVCQPSRTCIILCINVAPQGATLTVQGDRHSP